MPAYYPNIPTEEFLHFFSFYCQSAFSRYSEKKELPRGLSAQVNATLPCMSKVKEANPLRSTVGFATWQACQQCCAHAHRA